MPTEMLRFLRLALVLLSSLLRLQTALHQSDRQSNPPLLLLLSERLSSAAKLAGIRTLTVAVLVFAFGVRMLI